MASSSKSKTVSVKTSSGKTSLVKTGSKAEARYKAEGATFSSDATSVQSARDESKARTTARSNGDFTTGVTTPEITSSTLAPTNPIKLPDAPKMSDTGSSALLNLAGLATASAANAGAEQPKAGTDEFADTNFREYLKTLSAPPSNADIYAKAEKESGIKEKQAAVSQYSSQLNAITTKAQTDKLGLVGQGRGVTEAIIGGQQAQIDREAAIRALPVAAQLQAAQGDLEMAKSSLETLYSIRSEDARNRYTHQNKIIEAVYDYADKKQQRALDAKKTADDRGFQISMNTLNYAQSLSLKAIDNGQPSLAARISSLDPLSPTYAAQVAEAAKGLTIAPKGSGTGGSAGFKTSNVEQSVREDVVSYAADVRAGGMTYSEALTELTTLYGPNEVDRDAIINLLDTAVAGGQVEEVAAPEVATQPLNFTGNVRLPFGGSGGAGIFDQIGSFLFGR